jgi:uncharacterized protein YbjT (DUF2867 family)
MPSRLADRPTVAIAGATGFVGTAVRSALAGNYNIIGLTRSPVRARAYSSSRPGVEWRHCDLFDPYEVQQGLEGADYAIYLVHSMLPSSRLTQAQVVDLDLLLADNFARAAEAQGVRQILYVGGLLPEEIDDPDQLPRRLRSRREVEQTLGSGSVPTTTLRAGLIVGPGGTWLELLLNLIHRLPVMVLPAWTQASTQPIAIDDMVRGLLHCLGNPTTYDQVYDVGGPEQMTYREMLQEASQELGLTRRMMTVPVESPLLSKLWVNVFGGAPWELVSPIIDSLRYQAEVRPNPLQEWLLEDATPFRTAIRKAVGPRGNPLPNPRSDLRDQEDDVIQSASLARSVQRLPLPPGYTATDIANEYMRWLPRFGWPLLKCEVSDSRVARFIVRPLGLTLLELSFAADRSPSGRQLFYVTGGFLADMSNRHTGRLEFRTALNGESVIAAVHDFAPTLPWYIYNSTQALAHLLVMNGFGRHLASVKKRAEEDEAQTSEPSLETSPA